MGRTTIRRIISATVLSAAGAVLLGLGMAGSVKDSPGKNYTTKPGLEIVAYRIRLNQLTVEKPMKFHGLTVFPLTGPSRHCGYLTLDQALEQKMLRVEDTGRVSDARLINKGDKPVLVIDGEEIMGAKQNRVFSSSFMVAPHSDIFVKVSCVEEGRWTAGNIEFKSGGIQLFARARQANSPIVSGNLAQSEVPASDQAQIWSIVASKNKEMEVPQGSTAMHRAFEARKTDIDPFVRHFKPQNGQVGAIFAVHGEIIGMDIFDSSETFERLYPKLIKSYALDVIGPQPRGIGTYPKTQDISAGMAKGFLSAALGAEGAVYSSQGEGKDLRLSGWKISGGALIVGGTPIHIAVFTKEHSIPIIKPQTGGIAPPRIRRNTGEVQELR